MFTCVTMYTIFHANIYNTWESHIRNLTGFTLLWKGRVHIHIECVHRILLVHVNGPLGSSTLSPYWQVHSITVISSDTMEHYHPLIFMAFLIVATWHISVKIKVEIKVELKTISKISIDNLWFSIFILLYQEVRW